MKLMFVLVLFENLQVYVSDEGPMKRKWRAGKQRVTNKPEIIFVFIPLKMRTPLYPKRSNGE